MLLNWNNQYYKNDCATQGNLQIQYNPYQTTKGIFHRPGIKKFKFCVETKKDFK